MVESFIDTAAFGRPVITVADTCLNDATSETFRSTVCGAEQNPGDGLRHESDASYLNRDCFRANLREREQATTSSAATHNGDWVQA